MSYYLKEKAPSSYSHKNSVGEASTDKLTILDGDHLFKYPFPKVQCLLCQWRFLHTRTENFITPHQITINSTVSPSHLYKFTWPACRVLCWALPCDQENIKGTLEPGRARIAKHRPDLLHTNANKLQSTTPIYSRPSLHTLQNQTFMGYLALVSLNASHRTTDNFLWTFYPKKVQPLLYCRVDTSCEDDKSKVPNTHDLCRS